MAVLYATLSGFSTTDTHLHIIDPADMTDTDVGDTGHFFTGIAVDPTDEQMYGVVGNTGADQRTLFSINKATAAATLIGALGTTINDITFDSTGQMYGWKNSTKRLVTINKTSGAVVEVGASGLSTANGNGLAMDPGGTFFWLFPEGSRGDVANVDKATGAATLVGYFNPYVTPYNGNVGAADIGPSGVLYGLIADSPSAIFTVGAPVAGAYPETLVGELPGTQNWDGMAWDLAGVPPAAPTATKIIFGTGLKVIDLGGGVIRVDVDYTVS